MGLHRLFRWQCRTASLRARWHSPPLAATSRLPATYPLLPPPPAHQQQRYCRRRRPVRTQQLGLRSSRPQLPRQRGLSLRDRGTRRGERCRLLSACRRRGREGGRRTICSRGSGGHPRAAAARGAAILTTSLGRLRYRSLFRVQFAVVYLISLCQLAWPTASVHECMLLLPSGTCLHVSMPSGTHLHVSMPVPKTLHRVCSGFIETPKGEILLGRGVVSHHFKVLNQRQRAHPQQASLNGGWDVVAPGESSLCWDTAGHGVASRCGGQPLTLRHGRALHKQDRACRRLYILLEVRSVVSGSRLAPCRAQQLPAQLVKETRKGARKKPPIKLGVQPGASYREICSWAHKCANRWRLPTRKCHTGRGCSILQAEVPAQLCAYTHSSALRR